MTEIRARFAVVIPTWNEEGWLPGLLRRLSEMKGVNEVVVADNSSEDRTREIAYSHGARVVDGGRPARGRNSGAAACNSDFLVFADADVVFGSAALERAAELFESNPEILAVHFPYRPINATWFAQFSYWIMNHYILLLDRIELAQGIGTFMVVRRTAFEKANGFDEHLNAAEDADLIRRLNRLGTVAYDRTLEVGTSIRRFRSEDPAIFALKTVLWAVIRLFGIRVSLLGYRWRRYPSCLSDIDKVPFDRFFQSIEGRTNVPPDSHSSGAAP